MSGQLQTDAPVTGPWAKHINALRSAKLAARAVQILGHVREPHNGMASGFVTAIGEESCTVSFMGNPVEFRYEDIDTIVIDASKRAKKLKCGFFDPYSTG